MSSAPAFPPDATSHPFPDDRILVVGGTRAALDLLRLATIRSDDVVLMAESADAATAAYAGRFAVEWQSRKAIDADLRGSASVLVALSDREEENRLVRAARRHHIPIHVSGRPLVSDFTMLEFLEGRAAASAAA